MQFTSDIDLFELSRKYSYLQESFHSAMETSQRVVKEIVDRDNQQISTLLDGMETGGDTQQLLPCYAEFQ